MDRNTELLGHIEGLLEAWCDYGTEPGWPSNFNGLGSLNQERIYQLFRLLDQAWVVRQMSE